MSENAIKIEFTAARYLVISYGGIVPRDDDDVARLVRPAVFWNSAGRTDEYSLFDEVDHAVTWCREGRGPDSWGVWDIQEAKVVASVNDDKG